MDSRTGYATFKAKTDRLFDTTEAAAGLGKSKALLERHRWAGTGPTFIKIGRTPYYRGSDLVNFIEGSDAEK